MAKINFKMVVNRLVDLFRNKNTYIFLICVLVSFFMWIAIKSMEVHTYDAYVKIEFENKPDSYSLLDYNESIKVTYTGNGLHLYRFVRKMRNAKIVIDLDDYDVISKGSNYEYTISNKDLTNIVVDKYDITKFESLQVNLSRNYTILYTKNIFKEVDVAYDFNEFICNGYMLYKNIEISSSKAIVSGLEQYVNECSSVNIIIPPHLCIDSDTNFDFSLHSTVEGLNINPYKVNVKFYISPQKEISYTKEIAAINDYTFDTPLIVNINANAPAILIDSLSENNFSIILGDYDTVDSKVYREIIVEKNSEFIKDLDFTPTQIEIPQNND